MYLDIIEDRMVTLQPPPKPPSAHPNNNNTSKRPSTPLSHPPPPIPSNMHQPPSNQSSPSRDDSNNKGSRKKSLSDVLPEPQKPSQQAINNARKKSLGTGSRSASSPTPPLPPPKNTSNGGSSRPVTPLSNQNSVESRPSSPHTPQQKNSGSGSSGSRPNSPLSYHGMIPTGNPSKSLSPPTNIQGSDDDNDNNDLLLIRENEQQNVSNDSIIIDEEKEKTQNQNQGQHGRNISMSMDKIDEDMTADINQDVDEILAKYVNGDDDTDDEDGMINVNYPSTPPNNNGNNNQLAVDRLREVANNIDNINMNASDNDEDEERDRVSSMLANVEGRSSRSGAFSAPPSPNSRATPISPSGNEADIDLNIECKDNDDDNMDPNDDNEDNEDNGIITEDKEQIMEKPSGFGSIMGRFFKRSSLKTAQSLKATPIKESKSVETKKDRLQLKQTKSMPQTPQQQGHQQQHSLYSDYISRFSSFFSGDKEEKDNGNNNGNKLSVTFDDKDDGNPNRKSTSPRSPKIFNDSDEDGQFESDVVLHPQRNMFSDDWTCIDFTEYEI